MHNNSIDMYVASQDYLSMLLFSELYYTLDAKTFGVTIFRTKVSLNFYLAKFATPKSFALTVHAQWKNPR